MSNNNQDYRRGYTETVKLCAMMLISLADTETRSDISKPVLSSNRAESLRDECARLLNLFSAPDEFDIEKHDQIFTRILDIFTEITGNDSNAWLSYQPAMQLMRGPVN